MPYTAPIATPLLGWLLGALIPIEPDHLCSLIALNAGVSKPWPAFVGGATWGLGHSFGMLGMCLIYLPLQAVVSIDIWEHYGNYVAGVLLLCIGIYFLVYESSYLEEKAEGEWMPKRHSCSCCHSHAEHEVFSGTKFSNRHSEGQDGFDPESERTPLLPPEEHAESGEKSSLSAFWGQTRGAVIGMVQGLCCPSCIAGLAFIGQVGAQHPGYLDEVLFFTVGFVSLIFCSAIISSGIVVLSKSVAGCCSMSTRSLYRAACVFSIVVGATWIALNSCGSLHVIQYTDAMETKLHGMAGMEMQDITATDTKA